MGDLKDGSCKKNHEEMIKMLFRTPTTSFGFCKNDVVIVVGLTRFITGDYQVLEEVIVHVV